MVTQAYFHSGGQSSSTSSSFWNEALGELVRMLMKIPKTKPDFHVAGIFGPDEIKSVTFGSRVENSKTDHMLMTKTRA